MKNMFFLLNKKRSLNKTTITQKDIRNQAKSSFKDLLKTKKDCIKLFGIIDENRSQHIQEFFKSGTLIPQVVVDMIKFNESILDTEEFKAQCIFKSCIEKILNKRISFADFNVLFKALANASLIKYDKKPWGIETKILKNFDIDKSILTENMKNKMYALDEFILATDIITSMCCDLRPASDGFNDYESYYNYVLEGARKVIKQLQDKNLYSYHNEDRFAVLLISSRHNMPMQDVFYTNIPSEENSLTSKIKTEDLREVQEGLLNMMIFENDD